MEELTIEEKAQRYDEALEKARKYYDEYKTRDKTRKNIFYVEDMEDMFPELKESEDEKIRKEMIFYFQEEIPQCSIQEHADKMKKFITWLEKHYDKPQDKSALKAINEEKVDNANKIEPIFKIGDWIINTITNTVEQIIDITNNVYICSGSLIISFENQHLLRKWTIKDAKDGDVLVEKKAGRPFIFKGLLDANHPECPVAYGGIDCTDNFKVALIYNRWTDAEVCPATKEQYDALMKAMADARYTFDFEKKELKKIEQKTAWSEEDENRFRNLIYLVEHSNEGKGTKEGFVKFINRLKALKDRYTWKPTKLELQVLKLVAEKDGTCLMGLYKHLKKLREE